MMKKFKLLLLDADVVIEIFRHGIWDKFLKVCDVHLSRIVAGEAHFWTDAEDERHDFDLQTYTTAGKITIFDVHPSELTAFLSRFDPTYLERLHPGETESLAFLVNSTEPYLICSADKIVYRVLGNLRRDDQGISLQEILQQVGLNRQLTRPFSKEYRDTWTKKGFQDSLQRTGCEE